jgi:hypothetical protein
MNNTNYNITFKIYLNEKKDENYINNYNVDLNNKIINVRNNILNDIIKKNIIDNKYNYLEFENITGRVYKDYGKLFFDIGILPKTIDNYKISEFTNDNREFIFIVKPTIINKESEVDKNLTENRFFNKIYTNSDKDINYNNNNNSNNNNNYNNYNNNYNNYNNSNNNYNNNKSNFFNKQVDDIKNNVKKEFNLNDNDFPPLS